MNHVVTQLFYGLSTVIIVTEKLGGKSTTSSAARHWHVIPEPKHSSLRLGGRFLERGKPVRHV